MPLPAIVQHSIQPMITTPIPAKRGKRGTSLTGGSLVPAVNLNLNMQHQLQTQWCWSAVAVSIAAFYHLGNRWTQCSLANAELGQTTCCKSGGSANCNRPWMLDTSLARVGALVPPVTGVVPCTRLMAQIHARRPVGCRIGWGGGGGHFVAIDGYQAVSTPKTQNVSVRDPWYGSSIYSYANFRLRYHSIGAWTDTYQTKP
jgi:hypothetical protein